METIWKVQSLQIVAIDLIKGKYQQFNLLSCSKTFLLNSSLSKCTFWQRKYHVSWKKWPPLYKFIIKVGVLIVNQIKWKTVHITDRTCYSEFINKTISWYNSNCLITAARHSVISHLLWLESCLYEIKTVQPWYTSNEDCS